MIRLSILIAAGLFLLSLTTFGATSGVMLRPGGMYWNHSFKNGATPETKTTVNHMDLIASLGFRMDTGLYVGGTYFYAQEETKVQTGTAIETKDNHTAYGPTIGYIGDSLYLLGTYHLSPVYVTGTDSSKDTYSGGYGYQIDLGYMFWISSSVGVGPQFTYYYANFKKVKDDSGDESTLPSTAEETDIRPILAFAFIF